MCTASLYLCTASLYLCTTSLYLCTAFLYLCTTSLYLCTASLYLCTTSLYLCTASVYLEEVVASKQLKFAMETDVKRKAKLEKMVATTQLRLSLETEEERRAKKGMIKFSKNFFPPRNELAHPVMGTILLVSIGIHVAIYICLWTKKFFNRLVIDSPFQTFTVGLLVEFIDDLNHCFFHKRFPR